MTPSTKTPKTSPSSRRIRAGNLDPATFASFGQVIQNPETHAGEPKLEKAIANQGTATKWLGVTQMRNWYERARSGRVGSAVVNMFVCSPRSLQNVGVDEGGEGMVFDVRILERHPFTPQTFVPLGLGREDVKTCYLVIVAPTLPRSRPSGDGKREPPYPTQTPTKPKRSLKDMLLGARPSPFTNEQVSTTTPPDSGPDEMHQPKGNGPPDLDNIQAFIARGDQAVTYGPGTWHAPMVVLGEKPIEFVVVQYANGVADEDCQEFPIKEGLISVDVGGEAGEKVKARL
ncbi:uncharacterized protein LTR77_003109 [Saxophila tyrrhenica]|uniref:Ureidoglycolate hydrolase n=1 Tax=Saxophila tyrrhenica TaxID=1690608 RepID=A0AAV9PK05_9PEZI|nr:hypothetical protein LTR77_003109 [Saxophila tyrrhenica]